MNIREVQAKSILRRHKKIDSWFLSRYGMNLYRGCSHNCIYCDGRSEGYYVAGEFGRDVDVKVNAIEILNRELDPARKRTPLKRGFITVGGGVGDSYQPVEEKYRLTRRVLEALYERNFPVHVLTKSTLIKRDTDILKKINKRNRAIVSFSFSSVDDEASAILEPGVPSPSERLEALAFFKKENISCGAFLLPVVPLETDTEELIEDAVKKVEEAGADFILFGGMTLKDGKQKNYFLDRIEKHHPGITAKYQNIYRGGKWGEPTGEYYNRLGETFRNVIRKYDISTVIPPAIYRDILDENDLVVVMLEQIDYLLKLRGRKSTFGYAAYSVSQLKVPVSEMIGSMSGIKGVGKIAEDVILEILQKGNSSYYEQLLG